MAIDPLLKELSSSGLLDAATVGWARAYQARRKTSLDTALLSLDLIEEDQLLGSLELCYAMAGASRQDLLTTDPAAAQALPLKAARSFGLAPIRQEGSTLVALVAEPLETASVDRLRDLYDVHVQQLIAPAHYVAIAWQSVYGAETDRATEMLEERLRRRYELGDVREVLGRLTHAASLHEAVEEVLQAAGVRLSFCAFIVHEGDSMRLAAYSGKAGRARELLPKPELASALGAAIAHGGYFFGPLQGALPETAFYERLGRPLPRWAYVAPVPAAPGVIFYGDNAKRGIPQRWIAELTLLVARVGQHPGNWQRPFPNPEIRWEPLPARQTSSPTSDASTMRSGGSEQTTSAPAASRIAASSSASAQKPSGEGGALEAALAALEAFSGERSPERPATTAQTTASSAGPSPSAASPDSPPSSPPVPSAAPDRSDDSNIIGSAIPGLTKGESQALIQLRAAAEEEGLTVAAFVDQLLSHRKAVGMATAKKEDSPAIAGEVKGLFEKLATDIPAHFARGMEAAFRDLVPRIAPASGVGAAPVAASPRPSAASAAADIEIVMTEAKPREVEDYRARRRKSKRIKL